MLILASRQYKVLEIFGIKTTEAWLHLNKCFCRDLTSKR